MAAALSSSRLGNHTIPYHTVRVCVTPSPTAQDRTRHSTQEAQVAHQDKTRQGMTLKAARLMLASSPSCRWHSHSGGISCRLMASHSSRPDSLFSPLLLPQQTKHKAKQKTIATKNRTGPARFTSSPACSAWTKEKPSRPRSRLARGREAQDWIIGSGIGEAFEGGSADATILFKRKGVRAVFPFNCSAEQRNGMPWWASTSWSLPRALNCCSEIVANYPPPHTQTEFKLTNRK